MFGPKDFYLTLPFAFRCYNIAPNLLSSARTLHMRMQLVLTR